MPTLLQLSAVRPEIQEALNQRYTVHQYATLAEPDAWLADHAGEIDGVVTGGHNGIPRALMQALPNLKIIAINGVGYDRIDLDVAKQRGVRVTNTPDVLTDDVADLAVGLTLSVMRRLHHAHGHVTAGRWPGAEMPLARKVSGKRFGILGLGRIGLAVAQRLAAFNGVISYTNRTRKDVPYRYEADLVALARESDVLVVCAAASAATKGVVNAEVLTALGPQGFLINIARGSIVDEPALVTALQTGTIAGAGLDVFADEPHVPQALWTLDNVVLTPHIASATHETRGAMGQLMLDNLAAYFAGHTLITPVV